MLENRRVVFNIKGNNFRLVAAVAYNTGVDFHQVHRHAPDGDRLDALATLATLV